jgi:hypothetical protein
MKPYFEACPWRHRWSTDVASGRAPTRVRADRGGWARPGGVGGASGAGGASAEARQAPAGCGQLSPVTAGLTSTVVRPLGGGLAAASPTGCPVTPPRAECTSGWPAAGSPRPGARSLRRPRSPRRSRRRPVVSIALQAEPSHPYTPMNRPSVDIVSVSGDAVSATIWLLIVINCPHNVTFSIAGRR